MRLRYRLPLIVGAVSLLLILALAALQPGQSAAQEGATPQAMPGEIPTQEAIDLSHQVGLHTPTGFLQVRESAGPFEVSESNYNFDVMITMPRLCWGIETPQSEEGFLLAPTNTPVATETPLPPELSGDIPRPCASYYSLSSNMDGMGVIINSADIQRFVIEMGFKWPEVIDPDLTTVDPTPRLIALEWTGETPLLDGVHLRDVHNGADVQTTLLETVGPRFSGVEIFVPEAGDSHIIVWIGGQMRPIDYMNLTESMGGGTVFGEPVTINLTATAYLMSFQGDDGFRHLTVVMPPTTLSQAREGRTDWFYAFQFRINGTEVEQLEMISQPAPQFPPNPIVVEPSATPQLGFPPPGFAPGTPTLEVTPSGMVLPTGMVINGTPWPTAEPSATP